LEPEPPEPEAMKTTSVCIVVAESGEVASALEEAEVGSVVTELRGLTYDDAERLADVLGQSAPVFRSLL